MTAKRISRRGFLRQGAYAGTLILVGPGLAKTYAENEKLGLAHIAAGGRGNAHLGLSNHNHCVALCDVDRNRLAKAAKRFPGAKTYEDYRKLFDDLHAEIDAVVVSTPDHHHAPPTVRAIRLGKHVYTEKPLTWSIHEARVITEATARHKVATQMGNQGHANAQNRLIVEYIRSGAIGQVKEVHTWTNRPVWPQGIAKRPQSKPAPDHLNWDCWIGPATYRKYHAHLHPFQWRGWIEFGCGAIGDMGCHTWDCVWWSMAPDAPASAECIKAVARNDETFPKQAIYRWEFPAKGERPGFAAYWYEGGLKPPVPEEILEDPRRNPQQKQLRGSGNLFIGTEGKLLAEGDYGGTPLLLGKARETFKRKPGAALERSPGHPREWIMAAKGEKPWDFPKSNFLYGGPMVEAMLLGNVALLAGEKITWDPKNLRVTNSDKANRHIRRQTYRPGYEI